MLSALVTEQSVTTHTPFGKTYRMQRIVAYSRRAHRTDVTLSKT